MTAGEKNILIDALKHSPLVLLLGQNFFAARDTDNPVYTAIEGVDPDRFYTWWLGSAHAADERNQTLFARGMAVAIPEHFEMLRRLPWRCAFTSCIDPTPRRLLQIDSKRTVLERFQREESPDFTALPLFRLFGSAGRPDSAELPPTSAGALNLRRRAARDMVDSLSQLITPRGQLFIEGWRPSTDWLRPRDLGQALVGFREAQVLVFGLRHDEQAVLQADDDFQTLLEQGVVLVFEASLAQLIQELTDAGELPEIETELLAPDTVTLDVVERSPDRLTPPPADRLKSVTMSQAEWRTLNETFSVLRERSQAQPFRGTTQERYHAFREFLGHSPDLHLHRVSEFAFRRPMLDSQVLPAVNKLLQSPSPQDQALLISGQSGVGKTTLLSLLAVDLRAAGIPVVFVHRGVVTPNENQLDKYVQMVERSGSRVPTVIIYDGLLEEYEYVKLARSMGSRGRKVLVVGSAYKNEGKKTPHPPSARRPSSIAITMQVVLGEEEREPLLEHLNQFLPQDRGTLERLARAGWDNFFALLYHLLEAARPRLRAGLVQEIEREIERLTTNLQEVAPQARPRTAMQQALHEGLRSTIFEQFLESAPAQVCSAEMQQKVDHLIDAIMVAGRFDVPVPQSIALRLLGNEHRAYTTALGRCRILIERDVADGFCELTARQPLEAEIWCQERIPQKENQFRLMREMALYVRSHEISNDHSPETTFVVDLLRAVGPQGLDKDRTPALYPEIAEVVHELRQQHSRVSPRLLLIESNATREWIRVQERKLSDALKQSEPTTNVALEVREQLLPLVKKAADSLRQAIDMVSPPDSRNRLPPGARRLLSTLHTELANNRGTEMMCLQLLSRCSDPASGLVANIDTCLDEATRAWRRALVYDEEGLQAHDTACWILRNRLDGPGLSPEREADVLARWEEIIDQYRALNLSEQQQDKFDTRETELQHARGDISRFEAVLKRMAERGSLAVHVLRARFLAVDEGPDAARCYLEEQCADHLLTDRSTLLCYYKLWWQTETKEAGFFDHDSLVLPFQPAQWGRLLELATARLRLEGEQDNCMALFHSGWALLQGGQTARAKEVFDHLEIVSLESYRRGRTLALMSHPDGRPHEFFGETRGRRLGNRGLAWVEDLRLEVPFSLYEFDDVGSRPGRRIGPLHLALNYRGAFAQPPHKFSPRKD